MEVDFISKLLNLNPWILLRQPCWPAGRANQCRVWWEGWRKPIQLEPRYTIKLYFLNQCRGGFEHWYFTQTILLTMEWGGVNVGRGIYYSNKGKKRESRLKIRWKLFKKSNQTCLRCRNECSSWNHELVVYSSPVLTNHAQTRPFRISRGSDHSRRKSFRFWRGWTILEHLVLECKLTCAPPSSVGK